MRDRSWSSPEMSAVSFMKSDWMGCWDKYVAWVSIERGRNQSGKKVKGQNYPCSRQWRPTGLWYVETPSFSKQSAHKWLWGCQPYAPSYPCNSPWSPIRLWDPVAPTFSRQLTDGGEVVSLTRQAPFAPRKIPGTHCYLILQHPVPLDLHCFWFLSGTTILIFAFLWHQFTFYFLKSLLKYFTCR
jgi:hypothetical protein